MPLRLSLSDVAELARVRRPVASMWRTRFATGDDAFPVPVARKSGSPLFDAGEVAEWLARTGHGKNPDAVADAAAAAAPTDLDWANASHVAELDAIIVLASLIGGLADETHESLCRAAGEVDPSDALLRTEVSRQLDRGADWTPFVDHLIDAAYSAAGALEITRSRHAATTAADGSAAPLAGPALDLILEVTTALAQRDGVDRVVIDRGIDELTALGTASDISDDIALSVAASPRERSIRRHLQVADIWIEDDVDSAATVRLARVPATPGDNVERMLADADDVALSLRDNDVAVVVGPARALIDTLPAPARAARDDVLRSGRLRAAVRLPHGLVTAATREPLALWVLGPPTGDVPRGERFTAVADLIDGELTPATRADIVSDVVAGMGSRADLLARTFRFARLVRTSSFLARSGALLAPHTPHTATPSHTAALAASLDAAAVTAAIDLPEHVAATSDTSAAVPPAALGDLIGNGHARIIPGTRLALENTGSTGLVVVTADDIGAPSRIGNRRIDPIAFAHQHPSAQLTRPGDIVFRTSPTPAAWVDHDGSKVVAYPARVLRITTADPGGLVPELVATDIPAQPGGPGAWKRWMLRRVAPASIAPLRRALVDLAAARAELESRVANLDHYIDTLTAAVAAGAVTLTDPEAAPAASDPQ